MKSIRSNLPRKWFVHVCITFVFLVIFSEHVWAVEVTLEIQPKCPDAVIRLQAHEIDEIGINERLRGIRVEIKLPSRYHQKLRQMTQENIGKKLSIRLGTETLITGTIHTPLEDGEFGFDSFSEEEARQKILKFGREPDYHLKFTPQEIEDGKVYTEPAKNPWIKKAIYAELDKDYEKAEEYAKKAIKSDPDEPGHHKVLSFIYYVQGKKEPALEELLITERFSEADVLRKFPGTYLVLSCINQSNVL